METLLNKSIYYWGWFCVNKLADNLAAAAVFMRDYRRAGGENGKEIEQKINAELAKIPAPESRPERPETKKQRELKDDCFGLSWEEIASRQGSGPIRHKKTKSF